MEVQALKSAVNTLQAQNALLRQLVVIHDRLGALVLQGADVTAITRMTADLVTDALTMAWFRRKPESGAMHHSWQRANSTILQALHRMYSPYLEWSPAARLLSGPGRGCDGAQKGRL